ncbi:MAG: cupin domain-containing protein [Planctomycetota bacterium]
MSTPSPSDAGQSFGFDLELLTRQLDEQGGSYLKFLDEPAMECGLYRLRAGEPDLQSPHDDDEVYFVIEGTATLMIDGEPHDAAPGATLYVPALVEHRFVDITSDLLLLVVFSKSAP